MNKIFHFNTQGKRSHNLDRVIISNDYAFIIDGYECSERNLDLALDELNLEKDTKSLTLSGPKVKLCITGFYISEDNLYIYHCGDCRLYMENIGLISNDHTVAWNKLSNKYEDKKIISNLVRQHMCKNILTNYFGTGIKLPYIEKFEKFSGNILLCTDGFWNLIPENELDTILIDPKYFSEKFDCYSFHDNASCLLITA